MYKILLLQKVPRYFCLDFTERVNNFLLRINLFVFEISYQYVYVRIAKGCDIPKLFMPSLHKIRRSTD